MQRRGKDVEQVERLPGHAVKRSSAHAAEPARHASGACLQPTVQPSHRTMADRDALPRTPRTARFISTSAAPQTCKRGVYHGSRRSLEDGAELANRRCSSGSQKPDETSRRHGRPGRHRSLNRGSHRDPSPRGALLLYRSRAPTRMHYNGLSDDPPARHSGCRACRRRADHRDPQNVLLAIGSPRPRTRGMILASR